MSSRNNYSAKRQRPVIRVFVSSTFSDLKLERDALARRVFPKLEQLCQTEGFQFQAIDLRWGVSTEAGLDHRTMRIRFEATLTVEEDTSGQPATTVSVDHLDGLCRQVESRLTAMIDRQIKEYWDSKASEKQKSALSQTELAARDLEIERDEHLRLADEHAAHFVGREEKGGPLERIQAYLDDASRLPLLIHGDSGCGKTALLARAFKRAAPESNPVIRLIGVTPKSSDIRSLLGNLCLELRQLETGADPVSSSAASY